MESITQAKAEIARLGRLLYDRRLTDAAGGNISVRMGDVVVMSPRYAGSKYQWQLTPEQMMVVDLDGNILEGTGEISRESKVHLGVYKAMNVGTGIVHSHPMNVLAFASAERPIPPVLEDMEKFGVIPCTEFAPAHSPVLAERVIALMRGQEARVQKQAAAVLAARHGIFVLGKDLYAAYDAVERIDVNCRCILMAHMIKTLGVEALAL